jgi:hypothetical protein
MPTLSNKRSSGWLNPRLSCSIETDLLAMVNNH